MLKERIKSSAIVFLIFNMLFLVGEIWFVHSYSAVGELAVQYLRSVPVIGELLPEERSYSIPKENLSKPRKFLINDGSLWMAYYNTDVGYSPIEQRTRSIINGLLKGDITATRKIPYETWEEGLESVSVYIEYPISFSIPLLCEIMGVSSAKAPQDAEHVKDFIILPSDEKNNVCVLVRDFSDNSDAYAYMLTGDYELPAEDLSVYANAGTDGYYEPAFSTGLELDADNVSLNPLVLFSDSRPETDIIESRGLTGEEVDKHILQAFSFNPVSANDYLDKNGAVNYIENFASAKFYPDSLFEYKAVSNDRGIVLNENTSDYSVLNSAIDFAERVWSSAGGDSLNVLVTSDLSDYDSSRPYTFRFDYYCNGRPVEVRLPAAVGHEKMSCAIEMTVTEGRLIEYRQYMRGYSVRGKAAVYGTFVDALDGFVNKLSSEKGKIVIEDIYIGYIDEGRSGELSACWLARVNRDDKIYQYAPKSAQRAAVNQ